MVLDSGEASSNYTRFKVKDRCRFKLEDVSCGSLGGYIKVGTVVFFVGQERFLSCTEVSEKPNKKGSSFFICESAVGQAVIRVGLFCFYLFPPFTSLTNKYNVWPGS